jgi:hypothetical protein
MRRTGSGFEEPGDERPALLIPGAAAPVAGTAKPGERPTFTIASVTSRRTVSRTGRLTPNTGVLQDPSVATVLASAGSLCWHSAAA